ncbi:acyl-CoA thioesterase II [Novosphingobium sp. PY1]|uniref:acyl-CoA thioesterase n=1 Tax=Novosphingobium sp. PY1 TaxID=1882221 RepID=UPI000BE77D21|nr:acyl-CoA thioesterase II [Novosphingobium sp. PY1]BBA74104.1 acyl-CoA thioesterase II [Novosphingobium sp. PY1]GFM31341.1 acyl-CoA thioesterase II [Novosphingobium sp. PY1]
MRDLLGFGDPAGTQGSACRPAPPNEAQPKGPPEVSAANCFPDDPEIERELAYAFERTGEDRFRVAPVPSGLLRLFGGMVVSQCLAAARLTVETGKEAHSLHGYFYKPGQVDIANDFAVTREMDGRSFSNRLVRMTQNGEPLMNLMVSFKAPEPSASHAVTMPGVPPPEALPRISDLVEDFGPALPERHRPFWQRRQQVEWRPVEPFPFDNREVLPATRHFWFRIHGQIGDELHVHQRLLAYASDLHIFHTGLGPMALGWANDYLQTASLDHAIWFHQPFRIDEWLLYALDSPAASNALALGRGNVFKRDGTLVATVSQQGLARILDGKREGKL